MEIDSNVWFKTRHDDSPWCRGRIVSFTHLQQAGKQVGPRKFEFVINSQDDRGNLTGRSETVVTLPLGESSSEFELVKLRNLSDDDASDHVYDLITLNHLHEPAILCCLQARFMNNQIYTSTGPILIAVNPFKNLGIYSASNVGVYKMAGEEAAKLKTEFSLPPHVFKIADVAYRSMLLSYSHGQASKVNQSILVSGESGAGKIFGFSFIP